MLMKPGSGFAAAVVLFSVLVVGGGARGAVCLLVLDALHDASPRQKNGDLVFVFCFSAVFHEMPEHAT